MYVNECCEYLNTNVLKDIFQKLSGSYVFSSWNAQQFLYNTTQTYRQKHPVIITFKYEVVYHEYGRLNISVSILGK